MLQAVVDAEGVRLGPEIQNENTEHLRGLPWSIKYRGSVQEAEKMR
jgi:hypothetical protein